MSDKEKVEELKKELKEKRDQETDPLLKEFYQTSMDMCDLINCNRFPPEFLKELETSQSGS